MLLRQEYKATYPERLQYPGSATAIKHGAASAIW